MKKGFQRKQHKTGEKINSNSKVYLKEEDTQRTEKKHRLENMQSAPEVDLHSAWAAALHEVFENEKFIKTYATRLSEAFVEFADAQTMAPTEFAELGIPIGHRRRVREAAGKAERQRLTRGNAASGGGDNFGDDVEDFGEEGKGGATMNLENSTYVANPFANGSDRKKQNDVADDYGNDSSAADKDRKVNFQNEDASAGTVDVVVLSPTKKTALRLPNGEDPLTASMQEGFVITRRSSKKQRHHNMRWLDITGSCSSMKDFLSRISDVMMEVGLRDQSWMMSGFHDNKPMPFAKLTDPNVSGRLIVLRIPDLTHANGSKLADITNRLVLWWPTLDENVVLTYHRCDVNPLQSLADHFDTPRYAGLTQGRFFNAVVQCVVRTYREGLKDLQKRSDDFEDDALTDVVKMIAGMTQVQKQVAVYARCLGATRDVFDEITLGVDESVVDPAAEEIARDCAHHKISIESLVSLANELNENASSSINMQMALDGFRAGVNMKLFTYVSVFAQPITVATGWYGMNFANMPDLYPDDAYFNFIAVICSVLALLMMWLIYRSWFGAL